MIAASSSKSCSVTGWGRQFHQKIMLIQCQNEKGLKRVRIQHGADNTSATASSFFVSFNFINSPWKTGSLKVILFTGPTSCALRVISEGHTSWENRGKGFVYVQARVAKCKPKDRKLTEQIPRNRILGDFQGNSIPFDKGTLYKVTQNLCGHHDLKC